MIRDITDVPALPGGLPFDATQIQFTPSGAGAVARSVQSKLRDVVSVLDFYANGVSGALVDPLGVIDSTAGIQAALNSVVTSPRFPGTVIVPQGYYQISSALTIPTNVNLIGFGLGSQINQKGATADGLSITGTNCIIRDLYLTSETAIGSGVNVSSGSGVHLLNSQTILLDNVWVAVFGNAGFFFDGAVETRCHRCVSDQSSGDGFKVANFAGSLLFFNCITDAFAGYGFNITSGYTFSLIGCIAGSTTTGSLSAYRITNGAQGISLNDCKALSTKQHGFLVGDSGTQCSDIMFVNCTANGNGTQAAATYDGFNLNNVRRVQLIGGTTYGGVQRYGYSTTASTIDPEIIGGHYEGVTQNFYNGHCTSSTVIHNEIKTTTVNATPVAIPIANMSNFAVLMLEVAVVANQRNMAQQAAIKFHVTVGTDAVSTRILNGPTNVYSFVSGGTLAATAVVTSAAANAGIISLQLTGIAGVSVDWRGTVRVLGVTQ